MGDAQPHVTAYTQTKSSKTQLSLLVRRLSDHKVPEEEESQRQRKTQVSLNYGTTAVATQKHQDLQHIDLRRAI